MTAPQGFVALVHNPDAAHEIVIKFDRTASSPLCNLVWTCQCQSKDGYLGKITAEEPIALAIHRYFEHVRSCATVGPVRPTPGEL